MGVGADGVGAHLTGYPEQALLGEGRFGPVWLVRQEGTGRLFTLRRRREPDRDMAARVRRWAALDGPHLLGVHVVAESDEGLLVVADYLPTRSLQALLAVRGALPPGEIVAIATGVASALATAHAADLAHGAVRPSNVLFTLDGRPVLADGGLTLAPAGPAGDLHDLAGLCLRALAPGAAGRVDRAVRAALTDPTAPTDVAAWAAALGSVCPPLPVRGVDRSPASDSGVAGSDGPTTEAAEAAAGPSDPARAFGRFRSAGRAESATRRWWRPRRTVLAGVAGALAGVSLLAAAVLSAPVRTEGSGQRDGARGVRATPADRASGLTPTRAPMPPTRAAVPPTRSPSGVDGARSALTTPRVGTVHWPAVIRSLDRARAAAFAAGDHRALDGVDLAGSPAWDRDRATLAAWRGAGAFPRGLRWELIDVSVVAVGPPDVTVRTTDRMSAYEIAVAGRVVERRPARGTRPWLVRLRWTGAGWRVVQVDAA